MPQTLMVDRPLKSTQEELLGLNGPVAALAEFIEKSESPLSIALHGAPGSGRTSFLNLLKESVSPGREQAGGLPVVYVNARRVTMFDEGACVVPVVLKSIFERFDGMFNEEWKERNKGTGAWLRESLEKSISSLAKSGASPSPDDLSEISQSFRARFSRYISRMLPGDELKLLILIDELDRLAASSAVLVLNAIHELMAVPKCVFVHTLDFPAFSRGAATLHGASLVPADIRDMYGRLVQLPYDIPVRTYKLHRLLFALLQSPGRCGLDAYLAACPEKLTEDDRRFFIDVAQLACGSNPRELKRCFACANLWRFNVRVKRKAKDKDKDKEAAVWPMHDAKIVFALACMRIAWPEVFDAFVAAPSPETVKRLERRGYLAALPAYSGVDDRLLSGLSVSVSRFFDVLTGLIDTNLDGEIQNDEFLPIWNIVKDAGLSSSPGMSLDEQWKFIEEQVLEHNMLNASPLSGDELSAAIGLFRSEHSAWNDPFRLRLARGGERFYNILLEDRRMAALVTTPKEALVLYIDADFHSFKAALGKNAARFVEDASGTSHYGTGDVRVRLRMLARDKEGGQAMFNEMFHVMLRFHSKGKQLP